MSEQMSAKELATELRIMDQTQSCGEAWQELQLDFEETVALILADRKATVERCKKIVMEYTDYDLATLNDLDGVLEDLK